MSEICLFFCLCKMCHICLLKLLKGSVCNFENEPAALFFLHSNPIGGSVLPQDDALI